MHFVDYFEPENHSSNHRAIITAFLLFTGYYQHLPEPNPRLVGA